MEKRDTKVEAVQPLTKEEDTMHEVIDKKFYEWTRNIDPKERRIQIFEHIRDIPYVITGITDPENGPAELLKRNEGTCSPKHFLLGAMYQKLGIPVKYVSYPFRWGDLGVDYPGKLRALADNLPVMLHLALRAYINGTWVLLDATWDPPLKKVGFPVNENWNGISDMLNAVPSLEEVIHRDIQERLEYLDHFDSEIPDTEEHYKLIEEFCSELNDWLAKVRTGESKGVVTGLQKIVSHE